MSLTIEDGTGVSGANSLIDASALAAAELAYFGVVSADNDVVNEAALRRAFLYLKSLRWKVTYPFPVFGGTVPDEVKTAQAILAHYEKGTPNGLAPTVIPGQQKILTRVGEIGWTATGQSGVVAQRAVVTMAQDLLAPFINNSGNIRFIERA